MKSTNFNKISADFKEMPALLKLMFVVSVYSLVTTLRDLVLMKPVTFEYFGTGFPENAPAVWYVYTLIFTLATIFVFLKRSYSLLLRYTYFSLAMLCIAMINSAYLVSKLPQEQQLNSALVYLMAYALGGLIAYYQVQQKKYFNID